MWSYNCFDHSKLYHHGILGQKWGKRNGPPYPLGYDDHSSAEKKHLSARQIEKQKKADVKWAHKNYNKLYKKAYKKSERDLNKYADKKLNPKYRDQIAERKVSKSYANEYNRKMSELMNIHIRDIRSPSGQAIRFVAKRGEMGVHMALVDPNYDMGQFKNGIYGNGRVAYKKKHVEMA